MHVEATSPLCAFFVCGHAVGSDSSIAAAIASFNLIWAGGFLGHWLRSWAVAWILMLPVVIAAAPAILRLSELMTRPDAPNAGD